MAKPVNRKPDWLRVALPEGSRYRSVRRTVDRHRLHTVCQEARCPNVAECWGNGTATFMLLGDVCTRGCGFCAVQRGSVGRPLDPDEASEVAAAAAMMELSYVVLTSVTRDDLADGGASGFASVLHSLKQLTPAPHTEVLVPDYLDRNLETVLAATPDVFAHNLEVVERLTPSARHTAFSYRRSLQVLRKAKALAPDLMVKSSLMLGLGETDDEVRRSFDDLLDAGVSVLVLGQYLQPTPHHLSVVDYIAPERFTEWASIARVKGFDYVAAGPLVRTSYHAAEAYAQQALSAGPAFPDTANTH